jgi:hypothetical protein
MHLETQNKRLREERDEARATSQRNADLSMYWHREAKQLQEKLRRLQKRKGVRITDTDTRKGWEPRKSEYSLTDYERDREVLLERAARRRKDLGANTGWT